MAKQKVLYVMGPAYTGSTIFGLALGRHPGVVNLGEVTNLQHDYHPDGRCTCGACLVECPFWQSVRERLAQGVRNGLYPQESLLSQGGQHRLIDQRGGLIKLLYPLLSIFRLYPRSVIERYQAVDRAVFGCVARESGARYLVDLSKSPERLEILLSDPALDIWCVFLERDRREVYASTMARPKRTRARYGFKALRESFWLAYRMFHMRRIFSRVDQARRRRIDVASFEENPRQVLGQIFDWLGLPSFAGGCDQDRRVDLSRQHIYVGNRWLFKTTSREVDIESGTSRRRLSVTQRLAFVLFNPGA